MATILELTLDHKAPRVPSPCDWHGFAHGYYQLDPSRKEVGHMGTWMSSCPPPAVPCAPAAGTSVRLLGDSVIQQQAEHWIESFWAVTLRSNPRLRQRAVALRSASHQCLLIIMVPTPPRRAQT